MREQGSGAFSKATLFYPCLLPWLENLATLVLLLLIDIILRASTPSPMGLQLPLLFAGYSYLSLLYF